MKITYWFIKCLPVLLVGMTLPLLAESESGRRTIPGWRGIPVIGTDNRNFRKMDDKIIKVVKSDREWKSILTPEQYRVMRKKGTERPFIGKYDKFFEKGMYHCAGCDNQLFHSDTKYRSGTGWPSFRTPISEENIYTRADRSLFTIRTEVLCSRCDAHLGHVFDDGPQPAGLRYCLNSVALKFRPGK